MATLDWLLFGAYLALILWMGWRASRSGGTAAGHFVAGRSAGWLTVGLSVMATQASAITFIGTTGKAYADGMGFAQFYLGLPVAMVILSVTLLPAFRRAGVFTAYEWLGRRFDGRTRLLTATLFLVSRGLALGVVVYAPSVVLSLLLGWSLPATVLTMTVVAVAYTTVGGLRAVMLTDVVQMVLILGGLGLCLARLLSELPDGYGLGEAWTLAEATGRTELLDWSWDPSARYTVWSGLLGGTFLFLSYFGCDQSQVQRLLATKDVAAGRHALWLNAAAKIPLQLFVLLVGVVLFVGFHFVRPPLLFDGTGVAAIATAGPQATAELAALEASHSAAQAEREAAARALLAGRAHDLGAAGGEGDSSSGAEGAGADGGLGATAGGSGATSPGAGETRRAVDQDTHSARYRAADERVAALRAEAAELARRSGAVDYDDTNHVFPFFVIRHLPVGIVGLLVAALFAAAMSSMDSELNALATTSVVDVWAPLTGRPADDRAAVVASRWATLLWGALAGAFALQAAALGSAIEAVNTIGSYFYGSLLGVFVLALADKRATGVGAFWGLLAGMAVVAAASQGELAWLWLNPLGAGTVVIVGALVSRFAGPRPDADAH